MPIIDLGVNYTALYQHASHVRKGPKDAMGGDFDFYGSWNLWEDDEWGPGSLVF